MRTRLPSPAMLVALLALVVSLGGTGYAAVKIGTADLAGSAVTSGKIKNKTIKTKDLAPATVSQLAGQDGTDGAPGVDGSARAYSYVKPSPVEAVAARTKGMTFMGRSSTGIYCFRIDVPLDVATTAPVATPEYFNSTDVNLSAYISFAPPASFSCPAGTELMVFTYKFTAGGNNAVSNDVAFTVAVP